MLRFMGLSGDNVFNVLLYAVGGIVVAIIMIGSIFLIYNAFTISLNERTRQFGILSSVGATARQLRNSVLFEGLCIGAIGIPIGGIVGIGSIGLVIAVVARNFGSIAYSAVPLTLTVSVPAIVVAAAVSLVTILISAYIPARKAASTPVMESIRQINEVKVESKAVKTSKLAQRIYGLEGTLALKNFKRNKKRYRSIVLSLVLSVVLFISASSFVTDMKQASERAVVVTDYDIGFATQDMDDSELLPLYDKLKIADGVYESSYQALMKYSGATKASDLSDNYWKYAGSHSPDETIHLPMEIQFLEDGAYLNMIKGLGLPAEEYTGENAKMIAVAQMQGNRVGGPDQINDMFTSSSMNLTIASETNGKPISKR
ncbi:FtsX-like permease family protein [Paenibacillus albidus]|uniref:FtsX-like permease family protein n=1 Tax=Paenibacillus albidus TaxID=2041023 RepID=UPI00203665A8|nr:ABC transporter permease [Paenibacillus albidus]